MNESYNAEYSKKNYKHYHLKVPNYRNSIIKKLDEQPNKNDYIINLITEDIKKERKLNMRNFEELKKEFSREFSDCYDEKDIINRVDDLNESRDVYYLTKEGKETFEQKEADIVEYGEEYATCQSIFRVEIGNRNTPINVYCKTTLFGFNDEDGYTEEVVEPIGWDFR